MKNITVIGIGKLGLCFALQLEKAGYNVIGVDLDEKFIDNLNKKKTDSNEPLVSEFLKESKNFFATTDIECGLQHSNLIFLFVATPSLSNGKYNHYQIDRVAEQLINAKKIGNTQKHLIIGCTTMPGYSDNLQKNLSSYGYTISYNPEFIAQGSIMNDLSQPDIVLIGEANTSIGNVIKKIYEKLVINTPVYHQMSRKEAEITKIGLNCFLTTKISFANMIGDIVSFSGGDPNKVLSAIGSDSRIGSKYLGYGYGYGGPCFPRDNRALAIYANDIGVTALISEASDKSNEQHLEYQVQLFKQDNSIDKPVEFDYVSYKPQSTMLIESQQLLFAKSLVDEGYTVILNERDSVIQQVKETYGDIFEYRRRD